MEVRFKVSALRHATKREGAISTKRVLLGDIGATNARFAHRTKQCGASSSEPSGTGFLLHSNRCWMKLQ